MHKQALYVKGQKIGSYQVIHPLRQTRFGQTYLGQREQSGKHVIIEVFQPLLSASLEESFLSQAHQLMALRHPHILPIEDAGIQGHEPFLVTDDQPYSALRALYPRGSRQPLKKLLPQLKQVAAALHYAHTRGVLHRDLRPENILFVDERALLLTGFVIEAIIQNRENHGERHVEVAHKAAPFMPLEQIQGKASAASDQYWLAVLIYELLCGALPFPDAAEGKAYLLPLRQKAPDISPGVENVVMKALEPDPELRFPDVETFVRTLEVQAQPADSQVLPTGSTSALSPGLHPAMPGPSAQDLDETTQPMPMRPAGPIAPAKAPNDATLVMPARSQLTGDASPQQSLDELASEETHRLEPQPASPPAPRRKDNTTMTRRTFAAGLVGLTALGGGGGWYLLKQRLSAAPTAASSFRASPIRTTIHHTNVLIFSGHLASVNALAWSPDGTFIVSASDDASVQIFHASSGQRRTVYTGHTEAVATVGWSPDGSLIASGGQDSTVQIWKAASGARTLTYRGHANRVNGISWSNDSRSIASGSDDKSVQVWDVGTGDPGFNLTGHTFGVLCVGWQPNNSSVASGSWDGTLRDWAITWHGDHFAPGEQIFNYQGHGDNEVDALAWSPDGTIIASAGADQIVQLSHARNGTSSPPFFTGHQSRSSANTVLSIAWSPDGRSIASGDANGNVYVWNVADRTTFFTYRGHTGAVNALAWSPDGTTIASAGADRTVQIWQPR